MSKKITPDMLSNWSTIQSDFHFEVYQKTYALISTLEVLNINDLKSNGNYLQDISLPNMDISLALEGFDAKEIQRDREQLLYRGWIDSIYQTWEEKRNKMKKLMSVLEHDIIDDVMGDIRLIRNTLIHCNGIVGKKGCKIFGGPKSEGCQILKWFRKGDKIVLEMRHVLDIMHHMGVLRCQSMQFYTQGSSPPPPKKHIWELIENRDLILKSYQRKIVSVIPTKLTNDEYLIKVLFDNGVFGWFSSKDFPTDSRKQIKSWQDVKIYKGNLKFDNNKIVETSMIYKHLIKLFPQVDPIIKSPSILSKESTTITFAEGSMGMQINLGKSTTKVKVDIAVPLEFSSNGGNTQKIHVVFEQVIVNMYKLPCTIPLKIKALLENAHGYKHGGVQLDYDVDNKKFLDSHPQDVKYGYKDRSGSFQDGDYCLKRGDAIEFHAQIDGNGYVREIFVTNCNSPCRQR